MRHAARPQIRENQKMLASLAGASRGQVVGPPRHQAPSSVRAGSVGEGGEALDAADRGEWPRKRSLELRPEIQRARQRTRVGGRHGDDRAWPWLRRGEERFMWDRAKSRVAKKGDFSSCEARIVGMRPGGCPNSARRVNYTMNPQRTKGPTGTVHSPPRPPTVVSDERLRVRALQRWENEGGRIPRGPKTVEDARAKGPR